MGGLPRGQFWEEGIFPVGRKAQEAKIHNEQSATNTQIWECGLIKTHARVPESQVRLGSLDLTLETMERLTFLNSKVT